MPACIRPLARVALVGLAMISSVPVADATTFPGRNGKIAFSTTRHDPHPLSCGRFCNWEIYTMNPDGTAQQRLTFETAADTNPEWSPDGTKLAFLRFSRALVNAVGGEILVSDVYVSNPDGSDAFRIATDARPGDPVSWSPDGTRVAFTKTRVTPAGNFDTEIFVANTNGAGELRLTDDIRQDSVPVWSPDSQKIAWMSTRAPNNTPSAWEMNADGTNPTYIPVVDPYSNPGLPVEAIAWAPGPRPVITTRDPSSVIASYPGKHVSWSPDASKLGFIEGSIDSSTGTGNLDIAEMSPDGTGFRYVTTDPRAFEQELEWAPDSGRFVYVRYPGEETSLPYDLFVVNIDGSGLTNLTNSPGVQDQNPSWQPLSTPSPPMYVRPKGATPFKVSLVPAYNECTAPNREHGSPLASPSCTPPAPASTAVTVGTPDANEADANSVGSLKLKVKVGNPAPPEDSDVLVQGSISDVRCKTGTTACGNANAAAGADYVGQLLGGVVVRMTDRLNAVPGGGGQEGATVVDIPVSVPFACANTTSDAEGGLCAVSSTSVNALIPAAVKDGKRAVWQLGKTLVTDGGADGQTETTPNTLFMTEGLFVP